MTLVHGGQLFEVAEQYKIPVADWLDLSTGIAPISYPIPLIPDSAWQQLPQKNPVLMSIAKQYYQCSDLVVTNGSQAIIKALPALYRQKNKHGHDVYLPSRGYKEHAFAWQHAGYTLHFYQESLPAITELKPNCVVVIINPNNPTGVFFDKEFIAKYHEKIKKLQGLLVIDEAFIDVLPKSHSCVSLSSDGVNSSDSSDDSILVLRSFGKFFGLAGIRIGFLIAGRYWCNQFKALLGPWQVNGPAQYIATQALGDTKWHNKQCQQLALFRAQQETLLQQIFSDSLINTMKGCDLFITLTFHQEGHATKLYHLLCLQGVYCRLSDEQDTLRFGIALPTQLPRLAEACRSACSQLI